MNEAPAQESADTPATRWLTPELVQQRLQEILRREKDDDNVDVSRFGSAI